MLFFFEKINFTDKAHPLYRNPTNLKDDGNRTSSNELRTGLSKLIDNIKNRNNATSVPSNSAEKEIFYQGLEKVMRHIVLQFTKLEEANSNYE